MTRRRLRVRPCQIWLLRRGWSPGAVAAVRNAKNAPKDVIGQLERSSRLLPRVPRLGPDRKLAAVGQQFRHTEEPFCKKEPYNLNYSGPVKHLTLLVHLA